MTTQKERFSKSELAWVEIKHPIISLLMLIVSQGFLQSDRLGKLEIYKTYSPDKRVEEHGQQGKTEEL